MTSNLEVRNRITPIWIIIPKLNQVIFLRSRDTVTNYFTCTFNVNVFFSRLRKVWQKRKCTVKNGYLTISHGTVSL